MNPYNSPSGQNFDENEKWRTNAPVINQEQIPSKNEAEPNQAFQASPMGEGLNAFPSPTGLPRNDIEDNKMWAILGYFLIFCLVPLLMKKESPYAQYHAKQGLLLFGIYMGYSILGMLFSLVLGNFFGFLLLLYWIPGSIVIFALLILGIMNAANGKTTPLPIVGKFIEGIKI